LVLNTKQQHKKSDRDEIYFAAGMID